MVSPVNWAQKGPILRRVGRLLLMGLKYLIAVISRFSLLWVIGVGNLNLVRLEGYRYSIYRLRPELICYTTVWTIWDQCGSIIWSRRVSLLDYLLKRLKWPWTKLQLSIASIVELWRLRVLASRRSAFPWTEAEDPSLHRSPGRAPRSLSIWVSNDRHQARPPGSLLWEYDLGSYPVSVHQREVPAWSLI